MYVAGLPWLHTRMQPILFIFLISYRKSTIILNISCALFVHSNIHLFPPIPDTLFLLPTGAFIFLYQCNLHSFMCMYSGKCTRTFWIKYFRYLIVIYIIVLKNQTKWVSSWSTEFCVFFLFNSGNFNNYKGFDSKFMVSRNKKRVAHILNCNLNLISRCNVGRPRLVKKDECRANTIYRARRIRI